jgi:hypothetical protein
MTWWIPDVAIRESTLSPPCKLVLRTLADHINPPHNWDHRYSDDWDPATHPEALTVWCDCKTLSHATGDERTQLRLIILKLVNEYKILRQLRDPWFVRQRALYEARRPCRRPSGHSRHGSRGSAMAVTNGSKTARTHTCIMYFPSNMVAQTTSRICHWYMPTAIARFTGPVRLLVLQW